MYRHSLLLLALRRDLRVLPGMPNMLLLIHQHAKTYNNIRVQQQRDSPDAITALLLFGSETDGRMVMGGGRQRDLLST
ncbi:uncharacterized protein CTRU02_205961 [Colletotrichum truncatum]|uniref:Uncharacterized protein n=1 Tax=Colletotrichum truncatum TaxID=5467 RepID=A0ACC3Z5H1_COLTU